MSLIRLYFWSGCPWGDNVTQTESKSVFPEGYKSAITMRYHKGSIMAKRKSRAKSLRGLKVLIQGEITEEVMAKTCREA